MKTRPIAFTVALIAGTPTLAPAADPHQLSFPDEKIEVPSLSLRPIQNAMPPGNPDDPGSLFGLRRTVTVSRSKPASIMTIIVPREGIDPGILKTPDPSVDYKLIVKGTEPEPAR